MKRKIFLAISFGLTFGALVVLSQGTSDKDARASFLVGKVQVQKSGSGPWTRLKLGDALNEGDILSTGNASKATLLYRGSEFRILPNSRLKLTKLHNDIKDGRLEVQNGFAWFHVVKLNGKKFEVSTPTNTAGVRGTSFSAFYEAKTKDSGFCTCEGKVALTGNGEKEEGRLQEKGNGGYYPGEGGEPKRTSYEGIIVKFKAFPPFKELMKKNISLKNCLSCHTPQGWTHEETVPMDETYGASK
ncbi:sigma factor regulatory protein, FecR/PupR family [Leptospira inadai serovar Lyme str. 10]|uniref:Sigma factor regulatory protein, FecR/PupR family n=2 Tax=Leptospira inadai serovar Lyme TaxID=293084 RepID=V6HCH1_9LEPT|nr:FecR family protein [Leptospira inadai]EQA36558.1 sigma factor regulatory protein, FecR/PupR family [Leptospira inadai serovar Lyme str. 10]PNV74628.1 iron dicitrate transport regulator FecR [Leptospira inadai serovar Lyme]